jgi:hypothetical protein
MLEGMWRILEGVCRVDYRLEVEFVDCPDHVFLRATMADSDTD